MVMSHFGNANFMQPMRSLRKAQFFSFVFWGGEGGGGEIF